MGGHIPQLGGQARELVAPTHDDTDKAVSRVVGAPASPEALLVGVVLGAAAGVLAALVAGYAPGDILTALQPAGVFLAAWLVASWLLCHDTGRVLVVLRRGFFLGALQWGSLAFRAAQAGEQEAGGALVAVGGWVAQTMIWVCVAGFVVTWALTRSPYRELASDRP